MCNDMCDFGRILKKECNLKHFSRTCSLKNLDQLEEEEAEIYLWRAGLLEERNNVSTICNHHEQVFGKVFERKEKNCCGVLMYYKRKGIKGELVITLEIAKQLKVKNINVIPGKLFCCQCNTKYVEMEENEKLIMFMRTEMIQLMRNTMNVKLPRKN